MSFKRRLMSQSAIIFAARLFGAGLIFLAQAGIARFWGAEILGDYLIITAVVNIVALVMPLGFQTIGTYFVAEYAARGDRSMLMAFLRRSYGHVLVTGGLVFLLFEPVAGLFGATGQLFSQLAAPLTIFIVATAVIFTNSALLVGLRRPIAGLAAEAICRPLLIIGAFLIFTAMMMPDARLISMFWWLALGYVIIGLVQFGIVVISVRKVPAEQPSRPAENGRWWRFAAPWVIIALATDFFFDLDLLILSAYLSREELAIFGVCARIFALISFGVAAVYAVTVPDIFEAEARNDRAGFHGRIGEANLIASAVALALVASVGLGGHFILGVFGAGFAAGTWPLVVLSLGLLVRAIFGPASLVLSIHDRPYASLPAIATGFAILIGGNHLLVPTYGVLGAAFAALLAIFVWSASLWLTAYRLLGVDVSIVARLRVMQRDPAKQLRDA